MLFPMIIYKSENSSYGGLLPDFPGCYPMGQTVSELVGSVQDAVETWMYGEPPETFPAPSSLDAVQASEDSRGKTIVLVDIDPAFLNTTTQRINITVPIYALEIIDKAARARGMARSAFLVQSALDNAQLHP